MDFYDKVDPEEIIMKLEKLILVLEKRKLQKINNEEKLSSSNPYPN